MTNVPGKIVNLRGEDYEIPPLSLGQLRNGVLQKIREADELINEEKFFEAMLLRGEIIHFALKRNYPDLTVDHVLDNLLDLHNWANVWSIVMGGTGFDMGEENRGRAVPAVPAVPPPGTSAPSTGN